MKIDPSTLGLNDPLLTASVEVFAIDDYYAELENQIEAIQKTQSLKIDALIRQENLTPEDAEWHIAYQEYSHLVDFLLPRFFRGTFLVSLYALYESVVTEIAGLICKKQPRLKSLSAFKRKERLSFLEKARKYYAEVLKIELCPDGTTWDRLQMLSALRNAFAHTNGRVERLYQENRAVVEDIIRRVPDVNIHSGYITFGKAFVSETAHGVVSELTRLIDDNRERCMPTIP
jgi:hypothetical protein